MLYRVKYPIYVAKIKVVEEGWHGWSPEGGNIPPKENIYDKPSGSRLVISAETYKMHTLWSEEDKKTENMLMVDYTQKEGFRLFISWDSHDRVDFSPDVTLEPISGKVFPVRYELPLRKEKLKVGESFEVKPFTLDAGVCYTISLLDIYKGGDYHEVDYASDPSGEIKNEEVVIEKVED